MKVASYEYVSLFVLAFALSGILTPVMRSIALKNGILDSPTESHKTHRKPVPYLGGIAIVLSVVMISYSATLSAESSYSRLQLLSTLMIPSILMAVIGLIDDLRKLSPWPRFIAQNLTALFCTVILVQSNTLGTPTGSTFIDYCLSIFWIVGLTNSINFFDNLDGGASGSVAVSAAFIFILATLGGQYLLASISLVLAGATLGFLLWNRPPARIYMGDSGSLFLGILLASLTIRLDANPIDFSSRFAVPFFLVAVPILDTSVAVVGRIANGISPFQGGRDHLSHRLMFFGLSKRLALYSLWFFSMFFSFISLCLSLAPYGLERSIALTGFAIWIMLFFAVMYFLPGRKNEDN